jgi:hypothetical protein
MDNEFRLNFERTYLSILREQISEGLIILKKLSIADDKYKDVVVNLNNANNIALQLEHDIEELTKPTEEPTENVEA